MPTKSPKHTYAPWLSLVAVVSPSPLVCHLTMYVLVPWNYETSQRLAPKLLIFVTSKLLDPGEIRTNFRTEEQDLLFCYQEENLRNASFHI